MDKNECFVFVTHRHTLLNLSSSGELFHTKPEEATLKVTCTAAGQVIGSAPFTVVHLGEARGVGLLTEGGYLCAEPGGVIALQPHCLGWETFTLLPVSALECALGIPEEFLPRKPRQMFISQVIHQTFSSANIPEEVSENVESLLHQNPGWTYRYWSDKSCHDFIYQHYGWEILKQYLKINPRYGAARADLFRYLCVYQMGGVYLDIKSGCTVPFSDIILDDDQFLLSQWRNGPDDVFQGLGLHPELNTVAGGEYQTWHIIAAAGHPYLESAITAVLRNIARYQAPLHGVGLFPVLRLTGPIAYTLAINPQLHLHTHRMFDAYNAGLVYQAVARRPQGGAGHYSRQDTPIVL